MKVFDILDLEERAEAIAGSFVGARRMPHADKFWLSQLPTRRGASTVEDQTTQARVNRLACFVESIAICAVCAFDDVEEVFARVDSDIDLHDRPEMELQMELIDRVLAILGNWFVLPTSISDDTVRKALDYAQQALGVKDMEGSGVLPS